MNEMDRWWDGGLTSPTSGVIAEVKTELLCTMKVIPAPTKMAMYPVTQPNGNGKSADTQTQKLTHICKHLQRIHVLLTNAITSNLFHLYTQCTVLLTGVDDPLDDCSHLSLQHGVEQFDNEDQAGAEHQQRESQQDQTHCEVRQIYIHKEVFT